MRMPQTPARRTAGWTRTLGTALAALTAVASIAAAQQDTVAEVMRRAHEYVVVYEDHELSSVIATEHYDQQQRDRWGQTLATRVLRSAYLIFQLPPEEDWFALRDVTEVDGMPVDGGSAGFTRLFSGPRETATDRAMDIAAENARFNLGEVYRTINLPTFALRFLRPISRSRVRFQKIGEEAVNGTHTWVMSYREVRGPTFSATQDGQDVPASGRFWIEPETGAVMRSEMILGGTRRVRSRATITVTYRHVPSLGFRVPVEMRERYDTPSRRNDDVILAVATYSDFRRFDIRTFMEAAPLATEPAAEQSTPTN